MAIPPRRKRRGFLAFSREEEVRKLVTTFFESAGYKQIPLQSDLVYQRGSLIGSLTSFSPRGWKSRATVRILPDAKGAIDVQVELDINTTGQAVTASERKFWEDEMSDLAASLESQQVSIVTSTKVARASLVQNITAIVIIAIIILVTTLAGQSLWGERYGHWAGAGIGSIVGVLILWRWLGARLTGTKDD